MVEDHDYTSNNDFLGQFTLPFTSLRTGVCPHSLGASRLEVQLGTVLKSLICLLRLPSRPSDEDGRLQPLALITLHLRESHQQSQSLQSSSQEALISAWEPRSSSSTSAVDPLSNHTGALFPPPAPPISVFAGVIQGLEPIRGERACVHLFLNLDLNYLFILFLGSTQILRSSGRTRSSQEMMSRCARETCCYQQTNQIFSS